MKNNSEGLGHNWAKCMIHKSNKERLTIFNINLNVRYTWSMDYLDQRTKITAFCRQFRCCTSSAHQSEE